jgi:hypothetical protein
MRAGSLSDVRRTILRQHEELRARLRGLAQVATLASIRSRSSSLSVLLLRFAARFDAHLALEERELAPRIRTLDAWGSVREAALLAEHREQRIELERVCALAEDPASAGTAEVALAVNALVRDLLEDMDHEECWLRELAQIDEHGHTQMTG